MQKKTSVCVSGVTEAALSPQQWRVHGFRFYSNTREQGTSAKESLCVNPDGEFRAMDRLETLGELADITDFGIEDENFRSRTSDPDRMIVLSRHGWDLMLCLDFSGGPDNPKVVSFKEEYGEEIVELLRVSDFDAFFRGLRRAVEG
jgi:hypothetical protein